MVWDDFDSWKGTLKTASFEELLKLIRDAFMTPGDEGGLENKIKNRDTREGKKHFKIQYIDKTEDGKKVKMRQSNAEERVSIKNDEDLIFALQLPEEKELELIIFVSD